MWVYSSLELERGPVSGRRHSVPARVTLVTSDLAGVILNARVQPRGLLRNRQADRSDVRDGELQASFNVHASRSYLALRAQNALL